VAGLAPAGRWKATPVAVKIIEHYSSVDGLGSSRGNRISAGREMLFATSISHPNLVSCCRSAGHALPVVSENPKQGR